MRRVCVFCGSSTGGRALYADAATALARAMVGRGIGLVFGGGAVGLMGVIADAVLAAGGHAIGVIPHALVARELAHRALPDLRVVNSMHERKATMAALADAFVAMPGGFGTFEEFCEVVTWTQLGVHRKSCGLLNVGGFYDPLIAQFDRGVAEGFIKIGNRRIVVAHTDPGALLDALAQAPAPPEAPWIGGPEET
ncbi:MAG TPA: TIGR00730 family Rossman fold protein [Vicinamibacterales bacterium]|nr:TIGR00730 family Rossman fold protein [Vicinamibacterales bacterium]